MFWGYEKQCPACTDLGVESAEASQEARRQERVDQLEEKRGVPYNEFPPGF
jgi:hypothetical protein